MRPENAARTLATIGAFLLILASLLRLLSVYVLVSDPRLQNSQPATEDGQDYGGPAPALGLYAFSQDGTKVRFERGTFTESGWQGGVYTLNLVDGEITPGDLPQAPSLYVIEGGQVWRSDETPGSPRLALSPAGQVVTNQTPAQDRQALAYIDRSQPAVDRLYAIRGFDPAILIDEQQKIRDMVWSPDNQRLAYVAPVNGQDEIHVFSFDTGQVTRLPQESPVKTSPRFSRDGSQIAFLGGPEGAVLRDESQFHPLESAPASGFDIFVMDANGQNLRQLTQSTLDESDLAWTADNEIAFAIWQAFWPTVAYLAAISPNGGEPRRLYPATAIEQFACRPVLPGGSQAHVEIVVSNNSRQQVTVPLEVSASRQPLDLLTNRSQFRVQREELALDPGETRTLNWMVDLPEDLKVYLAASIESGVDFPISAGFCQLAPRLFYLPRLPLLRTSLLLWLPGSLLCLPWLRHVRSKWLWAGWAAYSLLLLGLMTFESWLLITQ